MVITLSELTDFVNKHAIRGACTCDLCIDAPNDPEQRQPVGHTVNVHFFKVALKDPNANIEALATELKDLIKRHKGEFNDETLLDGKEHSYIHVGGYIGDQGNALTLMGLGELLNLWNVLTPHKMLGDLIDDELSNKLAGMGMISIN